MLYAVVEEHAEAFFAQLGEQGASLPAFVHEVARDYDDGQQAWLDHDPDAEDALTQLQGASICYRIAMGPIAGRKTLRLRTPGAGIETAQHHSRPAAATTLNAPVGHTPIAGAPARAPCSSA